MNKTESESDGAMTKNKVKRYRDSESQTEDEYVEKHRPKFTKAEVARNLRKCKQERSVRSDSTSHSDSTDSDESWLTDRPTLDSDCKHDKKKRKNRRRSRQLLVVSDPFTYIPVFEADGKIPFAEWVRTEFRPIANNLILAKGK